MRVEFPKWLKLPTWLKERYVLLWKHTKGKSFTYGEALKILKEKDERRLSITLSRLNKSGWLEVSIDPKDSRKRIYKLKLPEEKSVKDLIEEISSKTT
jgi:DNA-binding transcriptional regulator PaaX